MKIGENIQKFRKELNLSQEELAERCGVSRQAVTKWEADESIPALEKLVLLADIFEITIDELVGRVEHNTHSRLMALVKSLAAEDIPTSEDDDISAIVSRYISFAERMKMDPVDILNGMTEIFLKDTN